MMMRKDLLTTIKQKSALHSSRIIAFKNVRDEYGFPRGPPCHGKKLKSGWRQAIIQLEIS